MQSEAQSNSGSEQPFVGADVGRLVLNRKTNSELPYVRSYKSFEAGEARFTLDGSNELEEHLSGVCRKVLSGILEVVSAKSLEGLLLAGGYGRGEGGVLKAEDHRDRPYNDMEFYVFLRGLPWPNERRYGGALRWLAHKLSPEAGVEVEFKLLSLKRLRRSPVSMFFYDMVMQHRLLWGAKDLLANCSHHCAAQRIPLAEATRLLMNRCTGLLFAQERMNRESFNLENADFVGRNQAKAQLAFGDVILTAHGQYHWSCRKRAQRLVEVQSDFPRLEEIKHHHEAGVKFKLHPKRTTTSRFVLSERQRELSGLGLDLWLWLERRRLKRSFPGIREYAVSKIDKCPETKMWRNALVNLKTFGPTALLRTNYPRERMLNTLPLLLWAPEALISPEILGYVQKNLRTKASSFPDLVQAYRVIWERFN